MPLPRHGRDLMGPPPPGARSASMYADNPYLDLKATARYAGLAVRTLRRYIAAGTLPHYRVGAKLLVRRSDVDAFMSGHRVRETVASAAAKKLLDGLR